MKCGPHREEAPARDFLAIYSETKLPLETSSRFDDDDDDDGDDDDGGDDEDDIHDGDDGR